MRVGWLMTLVLVIAATMPPMAVGQVQEAQEKQTKKCLYPERWKPSAESLRLTLEEHGGWAARFRGNNFSPQSAQDHPEWRANLCNADLSGADLSGANLSGANLNRANLNRADLNRADLNR